MVEEELRQQIVDEEHLRLLALGYKISAGVVAFYSLFGLIYVFMGILVSVLPPTSSTGASDSPPAFVGWFIGGIGLVFLLLGLTIAYLRWRTARCLEQRHSLVFCQVIAALSCLEIPYGTVLGIFTFLVLGRPPVRRLFT